ncbi:MAG: hypothetical protein N2643_01670 [Endomicrobia bacterium]|nr:hypothetical protein [Endomicrobiia bacterium]
MEKLIFTTLKIFFWITFGFILKIFVSKSNVSFTKNFFKYSTNFVVFILVPFFTGMKVWLNGIKNEIFMFIFIVFIIIMLTSYIISKFLNQNYSFAIEETYFPFAFMNTLYLGLPVVEYFVSKNAVYYSIIYSVLMTIIQFTFGIYFIKKKFSFTNFKISLPIIFTFILSIILYNLKIPIPYIFIGIDKYMSQILSPLMLCFIGYSLKLDNLFKNIRLHIAVNLIKISFLLFLLIVIIVSINKFYKIDIIFAKSIILISIMPSAIINYIILEKLKIKTEFTIGEIFWGTLITLFLLPYITEFLDIIFLMIK